MSSRMTSGIGANKWDDPTITSIGCGQQLRDSRWAHRTLCRALGPPIKIIIRRKLRKGI